MPDSVDRLYNAVRAARDDDPASSRTARLLRSGRPKMAKKLAEEAFEVGIVTFAPAAPRKVIALATRSVRKRR